MAECLGLVVGEEWRPGRSEPSSAVSVRSIWGRAPDLCRVTNILSEVLHGRFIRTPSRNLKYRMLASRSRLTLLATTITGSFCSKP
jgi:hypothetical protein